MDDLLKEFLTETAENLAVLDLELVKLEQTPNDPTLLGNIFRLVHTIKGTCGFLGLPRLERVAHAAEDVLSKLRAGEMTTTPEMISLILKALDTVRFILGELETNESEPDGEDSALIAQLHALAEGDAPSPDAVEAIFCSQTQEAGECAGEAENVEALLEDIKNGLSQLERAEVLNLAASIAPLVAGVAIDPERDLEIRPEPVAPPNLVVVHDRDKPAPVPAAKAEKSETPAPQAAASGESAVAGQTIRVSVDLLENLMTMVSELVLTRNQLLQLARNRKDQDFLAPLQSLSLVTSELQEGVMKTRMQPIGNAWSKMPRLIRDLSIELGKKIDLQMIGAETELDRQVLELIKDPLTHMVRNSADHGIETPEERLAAGKTESGRIRLEAYHEGGHIIIEIADDGRGLPLDKIRAKALKNGLATEAQLAEMSSQQIQQFIFRAGFSTAASVTSVSGRGVGMDVVRTNIEKIGGTVELRSKEGSGSRFLIKIPLTLAIVSALIVEASGERFAIPQVSVLELVRARGDSEHRIEQIQGTPVLRLRNQLLPLVRLRQLLEIERSGAEEQPGGEDYVVVLQVGAMNFGVLVDRVFDAEEIVVKPVAPLLRHITAFSGNTILGDGSVIMILDPNGMLASMGEVTAHAPEEASAAAGPADSRQALLLFRAGEGAPKAVPLSTIQRLEHFPARTIEWSDGRFVVQYRGGLMPLMPANPGVQRIESGSQPVLVFEAGGRSVGILVDEIIDIVEVDFAADLAGSQPEILGSGVIAGKATELLDTRPLLALAAPSTLLSAA